MKKVFLLCSAILSVMITVNLYAVELDCDITFNEPDYNTKLSVYPLDIVWSKGRMVSLGAGACVEYVSDSFLAFNAAGSWSYYSIEDGWTGNRDLIDNYSSDFYFVECGLTGFFLDKIVRRDTPVTIGHGGGYYNRIDYYTKLPVKMRLAIGGRAGIRYSGFSENFKDDNGRRYEYEQKGYELYGGINAYTLAHIVFDIKNDEGQKSFGKHHESYYVHNMYLDLLYNPDDDVSGHFGWRLGYNGNDEGIFNARIEGGKSTILGWNILIGCGIGLCI